MRVVSSGVARLVAGSRAHARKARALVLGILGWGAVCTGLVGMLMPEQVAGLGPEAGAERLWTRFATAIAVMATAGVVQRQWRRWAWSIEQGFRLGLGFIGSIVLVGLAAGGANSLQLFFVALSFGVGASVNALLGVETERRPQEGSSAPETDRAPGLGTAGWERYGRAYAQLISIVMRRPATEQEVLSAIASQERAQGLLVLARAMRLASDESDAVRRVESLELIRPVWRQWGSIPTLMAMLEDAGSRERIGCVDSGASSSAPGV